MREYYARFCENLGLKYPGLLDNLKKSFFSNIIMYKVIQLSIVKFGIAAGILFTGAVLFLFACQDPSPDSDLENGHNENGGIEEPDTEVPLLIGVRGKFIVQDHENVIPSLMNAPIWSDGVYINVRLTSDGIPVLMHDNTVDRTTDGSGRVNSMTLEEIQALDAGQGAQIPTLEEYLQVILNREESGIREPFKRFFLNPNDNTPEAIDAMYAVVMDSQFISLADRYTWQFGNLLNNDTAALHLRSLNDTTAIGTFLSDADYVDEAIEVLQEINGETILLWPGQYMRAPETLKIIADNGFEGGISRVSENNLDVIPIAHKDSNVKVLFTYHMDELSWWQSNK